MASAIVQSLMTSAKEARDEEILLASLRRDFHVVSMFGNGDCGFELMQRWREILVCLRQGKPIPHSILTAPVTDEQINAMRHDIANLQHTKVALRNNEGIHLVRQSLFDWSRSPQENEGRNREVYDATQRLASGHQNENNWFKSMEALAMHSSMIRTGLKQVFAEAPEMEAFSLLEECPLAIYIAGDCQFFPQSKNLPADTDVLVGVCSGNHYYLAMPKAWITEETDDHVLNSTTLFSSGKLS